MAEGPGLYKVKCELNLFQFRPQSSQRAPERSPETPTLRRVNSNAGSGLNSTSCSSGPLNFWGRALQPAIFHGPRRRHLCARRSSRGKIRDGLRAAQTALSSVDRNSNKLQEFPGPEPNGIHRRLRRHRPFWPVDMAYSAWESKNLFPEKTADRLL